MQAPFNSQAEWRSRRGTLSPIWAGGASDGALRRTVRNGDGWHPIRIRVSDFRDREIRRLREMADRERMPMPALCPRIRLRVAGEGSLDQIRSDLGGLQALGCTHVLLDTYHNDHIEATTHHETAWRMLETGPQESVGLRNETVTSNVNAIRWGME